ncbi:retrovirus-related pol polyprotein from transposon TNT 1-94 [Tanacetum coccineum]|uniref:Retrovirus-related pol polyprotein from transposon TNT 1-94 n=1 Tax=Tanacetum coccineum TaxID=301880 RepID=A0ABQ5CMP0_9ASTR
MDRLLIRNEEVRFAAKCGLLLLLQIPLRALTDIVRRFVNYIKASYLLRMAVCLGRSRLHCILYKIHYRELRNLIGKSKRKRLVKHSDTLPTKQLRKDHPNLATGTGGKTLAGLRQLVPTSPLMLRPYFQDDIHVHIVVQSARTADVPVYTAAIVTSTQENVGVTPTSDSRYDDDEKLEAGLLTVIIRDGLKWLVGGWVTQKIQMIRLADSYAEHQVTHPDANMAFDLRPTEDVLPWPGGANIAFDLVPDLQCLLRTWWEYGIRLSIGLATLFTYIVKQPQQYGYKDERADIALWGTELEMLHAEDIQCAGSDTRPPMLDKADFASWQQRIRLYCRGKENGVNILKSIDEGPFQMGTTRAIVAEGTEGLPKDIYSLINHYTDTKDIWDNVKMLLEGSELTKEDRESQLYDDFEHFRQNKGEITHDYYARFVTPVKLNKALKDSNFDQLYAYLKQHEAHANENKMMLERLTQQTVDPLALISNVSPQHYQSQSSTNPPITYHQPHSADTLQSDLGLSPTNNLIENLTSTLTLLTQSYKTFLPQINNQLRTSSNPRNQATVQDDRVVVQNGRQNRGQGNNARGAGTVSYGRTQNRVGNANPGQARQVKCYNCNGIGHIARNCTQLQRQDVADASSREWGNSGRDIPGSYVPTSYDSDVLSEVHDHDHYQDAVCDHHEEHEMHDDVQPNHVVESHADYTSDNNMTPYDQYVKDNAAPVVQNNASMVPNDAYVIIDNDVHKSNVLSVSQTPRNTVANNLLNAELATYKEQVELYERRARFELTEREQKIDEQLRIVICDRNIKEENLKKELHSVKLQLASTIQHNKSCRMKFTSLKKDFNQKENKYLEEFLDLKALKDKVEDKLFKQGQSIQTVHWHIVKMKVEALKEQNTRPIKALTVYPPNTPATLVPRVLPTKSQVKINIFTLRQLFSEFDKTCKKRITPTRITEGEKGFEQTKTCYLTEVIPFFKTLQEHFEGIQKALTKEVKEMSDAFDELKAELDQSIMDRKHDEIERKNILIEHDNIIAHDVVKAHCLELEAELSNLRDNETRSEPDQTLDFRALDFQISQLTEKVNGLHEQNELFRAENAKIKQNYKELYDSIKITRAKHTEQTTALKSENECLKVQIQNTVSCVTTTQVKPKVIAPGKYALDVEPIPPCNRNNREVHLVYLRHLKESVDTLREIVEEAKVERPLDRSLAFACRYTKHSQELLEYVFGTCPKVFNQQDKKHANTPRKKQVTFEDQSATSSSTTHKHVEPMHTQKSNVPVPPSTGVNSCTDASGSQPRSILKKHRIPPAKSDSLEKVEDHSRTIRSSLKTTNRVDSSISSKRTVINSNSHSVCQTCNKCLFSANHDMCVVTYLHSVNASPNVKNVVRHVKQVWKPKQVTQVGKPKHIKQVWKPKQIWKPTGKTLNNVGYQWRPTGRTFTLSDQCPLTRFTKLTGMSATACANQSEPNQHWGSNFPNSPSSSVFKCRSYKSSFVRFGNDHFGAIMGYGDYVIGDSVISRVYYVEGLGHNLFSVGQFCDSDLEVAFRKHSCYVRDTDGVELLKGSRGSNLYTISVEDMMKSSPICLLSKASKNKSWLWHRRLNHLNFGTINDLARKDLVRGLPRLKFEKDHLCSACQLGKSKKHTHKPKTENTNLEVLNTLHMDLCGPMRVQTINGKKYILVIVDDYSRFTWVKFLRSKDETPAVVIKFLTQIQVGLNKTVRFIRTDNGTEFVNKTLYDHYEKVGIFHQKTVPRTPQQNGVVERRNRTLVEAARTMLIFSKAPMFLWAEAVATACYTQNRSLIHTRHDKTPYELVHIKKPDLTFFRVFGALCYPTNDSQDLGKRQPTADIGIFVGYAPIRKGYRIYNKPDK